MYKNLLHDALKLLLLLLLLQNCACWVHPRTPLPTDVQRRGILLEGPQQQVRPEALRNCCDIAVLKDLNGVSLTPNATCKLNWQWMLSSPQLSTLVADTQCNLQGAAPANDRHRWCALQDDTWADVELCHSCWQECSSCQSEC
jgi:hypothetical protein